MKKELLLHPAFGLDEDWNHIVTLHPPGQRRCIRLSGWMRIGTWNLERVYYQSWLHPAFGLDEDWNMV